MPRTLKNDPKERPILFSGPMVRAILDGRKTQTRRAVKFVQFDRSDTPGYDWHFRGTAKGTKKSSLWQDMRHKEILRLCPYGQSGDRLWVRETHCKYGSRYIYRADYGTHTPISDGIGGPWKPSIHMPRVASRITLEIAGVRVERLNEISEIDAIAEGCGINSEGEFLNHVECGITRVQRFKELWQSINGPDSWDANPWVWVVEFKRVEATQ